jgi:integrase
VADLVERYCRDYAPRKKTGERDRKLLEKHILPRWGARPAASVTRSDVERLHTSMRETPIGSNRLLALLSTMMRLAEHWEMRPEGSNPCRGVQHYAENRRDRFLSSAELARLGKVLRQVEAEQRVAHSAVPAIKLLLFTGMRRGEALQLRWEDLDLETSSLRLRDSKTGPRRVRLNAPARALLAGLPQESPWVFPKDNDKSRPVRINGPWAKIRKRAGLEGVTVHDLRHAHASMAVNSGVSLPLIAKLLGHSTVTMAERYAHLADDPLQEASERTGERLAASLEGMPLADVIGLSRR